MSKQRQKYKIAGAATWELIRAAYLGGESAPALAERFGVNVHGIRKRITKEGWTKRDYAAALEARGVTPSAKPKPNFIEEGVLREQVRVAAEDAEATKREAKRMPGSSAWRRRKKRLTLPMRWSGGRWRRRVRLWCRGARRTRRLWRRWPSR